MESYIFPSTWFGFVVDIESFRCLIWYLFADTVQKLPIRVHSLISTIRHGTLELDLDSRWIQLDEDLSENSSISFSYVNFSRKKWIEKRIWHHSQHSDLKPIRKIHLRIVKSDRRGLICCWPTLIHKITIKIAVTNLDGFMKIMIFLIE